MLFGTYLHKTSHFQATGLFMNSEVQKAVKYYYSRHNQKHKVVKLRWTHVEGAFGILCVGHGLSLIIFVLEMLIH